MVSRQRPVRRSGGAWSLVWVFVHMYTFHEFGLLAPSSLGIVPFLGHTYRSCRCVEQGRPSQSSRSLFWLRLFGRRVSGFAELCSDAAIPLACRLRVCF